MISLPSADPLIFAVRGAIIILVLFGYYCRSKVVCNSRTSIVSLEINSVKFFVVDYL